MIQIKGPINPATEDGQAKRTGKALRSRIDRSVMGIAAFLLFFVASAIVIAVFNSEIHDRESGVQSDYLIDAYYYTYLGRQAGYVADLDGTSLFSAAESIAPNASSTGVVFLAALVLQVTHWEEVLPLLLALMLFAPIMVLYRAGASSPALLCLPFCGLFPYFGVPSKEVFLIGGLLLLVVAVTMRCYLLLGSIGLALIFFGRPEAFYILVACVGAWVMCRTRVGMVVTAVGALVAYGLVAREPARAASLLHQLLMDQVGVGFCSVGPLNVCVDDSGVLELPYLTRLLVLTPLPLKWLADLVATFTDGSLLRSEVIIRWANCLHLLWLYAVFRQRRCVTGRALALRQTLLLFAAVYWAVYGSIFFFQPTRPAILATTIMGLAFLVRNRQDSVEGVCQRHAAFGNPLENRRVQR
jgi:hypothetical protein